MLSQSSKLKAQSSKEAPILKVPSFPGGSTNFDPAFLDRGGRALDPWSLALGTSFEL
jgi:hypothetical protein